MILIDQDQNVPSVPITDDPVPEPTPVRGSGSGSIINVYTSETTLEQVQKQFEKGVRGGIPIIDIDPLTECIFTEVASSEKVDGKLELTENTEITEELHAEMPIMTMRRDHGLRAVGADVVMPFYGNYVMPGWLSAKLMAIAKNKKIPKPHIVYEDITFASRPKEDRLTNAANFTIQDKFTVGFRVGPKS
jgi:hypothetical protein